MFETLTLIPLGTTFLVTAWPGGATRFIFFVCRLMNVMFGSHHAWEFLQFQTLFAICLGRFVFSYVDEQLLGQKASGRFTNSATTHELWRSEFWVASLLYVLVAKWSALNSYRYSIVWSVRHTYGPYKNQLVTSQALVVIWFVGLGLHDWLIWAFVSCSMGRICFSHVSRSLKLWIF